MASSLRFSELHCLSNFTFLRGASHPHELVEQAINLGYTAIAITDECSVSGAARAYIAAKNKIKLIIGSEFRLDDGLHFVLLAKNRNGYAQICKLITKGRINTEKGTYQLTKSDCEQLDFSECLGLWIPDKNYREADAQWLGAQVQAWIACEIFLDDHSETHLKKIDQLSERLNLPVVASNDVHMHDRERQKLQDTLTAIRLNTTLDELGYTLYPNAERHLRSKARLAELYPRKYLEETQRISEQCNFNLGDLRYEYPQEIVPKEHSPTTYLKHLTLEGANRRWPKGTPKDVARQIEKELQLISELSYEPFFLTVYDAVKFARSQKILCQGRGSSANSVVCYCLGITEVDPEHMNLLFERFISKERDEPPDIDVDFEHERREEVIQYLYQKYGRHRTALAATVVRYRSKSALRDVGKALGFSEAQLALLSKTVHRFNYRSSIQEKLSEHGFKVDTGRFNLLAELAEEILDFPRHLSQHVGGFVIAKDDISNLVPVENASMPDRTVIQWDKEDLESLGLLKVDVLSLGMLTVIRKAFAYISQTYGHRYSIAEIMSTEDKQVYEMIQHADTVGVFQIESRAQMSMLPRLKPANYYDLVIEIAIVRPGPIQGDMLHPYLRRRKKVEDVDYPDERIRKVLERTLGIPIFQEQVMSVVVEAAGFTPGEADQVRRSMAAWTRKGGLEPFEKKLKAGMAKNGYSPEFTDRIYKQILGFGEYGFPESHSASFAILAYVSAWLKYYYPAAFTAALLNSQPMGFYAPAQLVGDARRHGVSILPIDANQSFYDATLECLEDQSYGLRLGLREVKGLSKTGAKDLVNARERVNFKDAQDLSIRAQLKKADMEALAAADALTILHGHRRKAFWAVSGIEGASPIFPEPNFVEAEPMLIKPSEKEDVIADYEAIGLSIKNHPLALIRPYLDKKGITNSQDLWEKRNGSVAKTAGLVLCRQKPKTSGGATFLTLEDEFGTINIIVWGSTVEVQYRMLLEAQLIQINGVIQQEDGVLNLIAGKLENGNQWLGTIDQASRNFH